VKGSRDLVFLKFWDPLQRVCV